MKKITFNIPLLLVFFLSQISIAFAQDPTFQWAVKMGGSINDEPYAICLDNHDNIYTTGVFQGTADFDPGPGVYNLTGTTGGGSYISKLDSSGNFVWAKAVNSNSSGGSSIHLDLEGNIYITGFYSGTGDFDPGASIYNLTSSGLSDVFILKLDSSGNFKWAKSLGGLANDASFAITTNKFGEVICGGNFSGTSDFDPGTGIFNLTATPSFSNSFVVKLDSNGSFNWAKGILGNGNTACRALQIDSSNNVFVAGGFGGIIDFDPGAGLSVINDTGKGFVLKLDHNGDFHYVKNIGGIVNSLCLDAFGNIITTGLFNNSSDFDPSSSSSFILAADTGANLFVSKLDSNGNFIWAKSIGDTIGLMGLNITCDLQGNIYCSGQFTGTTDFDPDPLTTYYLTASVSHLNEIFALKLSPTGIFKWAIGMGSTLQDYGDAIVTDLDGNVFLAGHFRATVDFNPGSGVYNLSSTSSSTYDIFIEKFDQCQNSNTLTYNECPPFTINGQTYTSSGTYFQVLTNSFGCDSLLLLHLSLNTINNAITQTGSLLDAVQSGVTYQWVECPTYSIIPGATNQSYNATSNGSYALILSNGGCIDTSSCVLVTGLGIENQITTNEVQISPNPVNDILEIHCYQKLDEASLKLYNTTGQILLSKFIHSNSELKTDVSNLPKGIYFLQFANNDIMYSMKLIKN